MLDILVTVGVILLLIALAALMLHLVNTHQAQRVAASDYERFHAGEPPRTPSEEQASAPEKEPKQQPQERRDESGGGPPAPGTA